MPPQVTHYFDYKSPYAYLAQEATYALEDDFGITVQRLPYTLDIPSFLGEARLNERGEDTIGTRSAHQWRRVRYSYMDCRREASRRGLIVRGPQKIWDSSRAHIAFLYAQTHGAARAFHDAVYLRFWRRELDLEDLSVLKGLLSECAIETHDFLDFVAGPGRVEHDRIREDAEALGVFGVPSWLVDGELFWGSERLELVRERIANSTPA